MGLVRSNDIGGFEDIATAHISTGGSESNFAIGISRMGLNSTWLSRIGDDGIGRKIKSDVLSQGVRVLCNVDENASSGLMIKTTPRAGRTEVMYFRSDSAASHLSVADFGSIRFSDFDALHFTGITPGLSESCEQATAHAIKEAREQGLFISMDVNFRSKIWSQEDAKQKLSPFVSFCDLVIASVDEAQILLGSQETNPQELAETISRRGPNHVVIKQGEQGATSLLDGNILSMPSMPIEVVDSVGAGDAFTATYVATYLREGSQELALTHAIQAGALACTHPGDWQGIPYLSELTQSTNSDPVKR